MHIIECINSNLTLTVVLVCKVNWQWTIERQSAIDRCIIESRTNDHFNLRTAAIGAITRCNGAIRGGGSSDSGILLVDPLFPSTLLACIFSAADTFRLTDDALRVSLGGGDMTVDGPCRSLQSLHVLYCYCLHHILYCFEILRILRSHHSLPSEYEMAGH